MARRTKSVVVTGGAAAAVDQARSTAGSASIRGSMARVRPANPPGSSLCPLPATPAASLSPVRTPDAPLVTDMNPPGLEQKLRIRALRFSWIKDVVQAVAFTAAGLWAIYTFWYREKYLPRVTEANLSAHVQLERLGEKEGTQALRITVSMDNPGPATARILGSTVIARGIRVLACPPPERPRPAPNVPLEVGTVTWLDRTLESRPEILFNSVAVPESFDNRSSSTVRPGGRNEEETVLFLRANS